MLTASAAVSDEAKVLLGNISDFPVVEKPDETIDVSISAISAAATLARNIFPTDIDRSSLAQERDLLISELSRDVSSQTVTTSLHFGLLIAQAVLARSSEDGLERATVDSLSSEVSGAGRWVPTPPSFQPASDPGWGTLRHFVLPTSQCNLPAPLTGGNSASPYATDAQEVFQVSNSLTEEQKKIARFWDDGRGRSGTPTGHWLGIALALNRSTNAPVNKVILSVAATAFTSADAMIDAWREKYTYRVERPVTILEKEHPLWNSYLVTPAFPEYPSGHSTVSKANAVVLSQLFGEVPFVDPGYGMTEESRFRFKISPTQFSSVSEAADQSSISRLYGGIHFSQSLQAGQKLGECVAVRTIGALSAD